MTPSRALKERARVGISGLAAIAVAAQVVSTLVLTRENISPSLAALVSLFPSVLLGAIGMAARFAVRAMPIRSGSAVRILAAHFGSAAAVGAVWAFLWVRWLLLLQAVAKFPALPVETTMLATAGGLLYLVAVAGHYLLSEIEASRTAEETALRYQVLAREAELKAFKAQVDPHFLFNSLNAIASLCGTRPMDARQMSQLLADFFRLTLRVGAMDRISFGEEIDLASRYLAVEKIRFGDRLDVRVSVSDDARNCSVPPLILQPLVENAVRHGIASMLEGGTIDIDANVASGRLRVVVENPTDPDRDVGRGEGIGLANSRGRLLASYNGSAHLVARHDAGKFRVEIELPCSIGGTT